MKRHCWIFNEGFRELRYAIAFLEKSAEGAPAKLTCTIFGFTCIFGLELHDAIAGFLVHFNVFKDLLPVA